MLPSPIVRASPRTPDSRSRAHEFDRGSRREPIGQVHVSKRQQDPKEVARMKATGQGSVDDESVAPVTILDGTGRVVQTITADEFRRIHGIPERPKPDMLHRRKGRSRASENVRD